MKEGLNMNSSSNVWPLLDFTKFPNEMISGLSLNKINEVMNQDDEDRYLPQILSDDFTPSCPPSQFPSANNMIPSFSLDEINELMNQDDDDIHLPHNLNPTCPQSHFTIPAGDTIIEKSISDNLPAGTKKRNNWALTLYSKWQNQREITNADDANIQLPDKDNLTVVNTKVIDYWLAKFIFEIRRQDGCRYPRNTLISLVAGFNAYFLMNKRFINLFKDEAFHHFREVLDVACRESSKSGANCSVRQAEPISFEEEELLWSRGYLGDKDPKTLVNTLVYLNGLHFALRSGQEHRSLTVDQIKIIEPTTENKYYVLHYTETVSKTNNGGLKHREIEPKKVKHIDINSVENSSRSHSLLLIKYFGLRPANSSNVFYLTPLRKTDLSGNCYKTTPLGHNPLAAVVKNMCSECGIVGHKTNHSLRATCATRLYEKGVDEQVIMERTGHRSTKGVRSYKRTSSIHHHNSSVVIDSNTIQNQTNSVGRNNLTFHFHSGCNVVINNVPN